MGPARPPGECAGVAIVISPVADSRGLLPVSLLHLGDTHSVTGAVVAKAV